MLVHHHLVVRALTLCQPGHEEQFEAWLTRLIDKINMNILFGPKVLYSTKENNEGYTGFAIIDTSHIVLHTWDSVFPIEMQLDVYSCAPFNVEDVTEMLKEFEPVHIDYKFLDRTNKFKEIQK